MGAAAYGSYQGLLLLLKNSAAATILAVCVGGVVYGCLLLKLGGVEQSELRSMPGGTKVIALDENSIFFKNVFKKFPPDGYYR